MIKTAIAAAVVAMFASTAAHSATDCLAKYDDFWEKMRQFGAAKPSPEAVVDANRKGLRAFDACQSGDEASDFAHFWENMQLYGGSKPDDAKKFWENIQKAGAK
ncbi:MULTISPECIES: hypothetical protein [Rhodomicrobium]|uniref:hypothetical protein n=1 Tax=Rhodomicrobium TaxID=1068 RepID=UPI000B4A55D1|nr:MULTISPECIES: hypothetical protein [Rhodomicrobium]